MSKQSSKTTKKSGGNVKNDGMDEEDRRFFEELSKGFTAKDTDQVPERNELMDDTRATRQMLAAQKAMEKDFAADKDRNELGTIDFNADREESKEDEYDYFLDN